MPEIDIDYRSWMGGYLSCGIDTDGCLKMTTNLIPQIQWENTNVTFLDAIAHYLDLFDIKYYRGTVRDGNGVKAYFHVTIGKLSEVKRALKMVRPIAKREQWYWLNKAVRNRKDRAYLQQIRERIMELNAK